MEHDPAADRLISLHKAAIDSRNGYDEARKDARGEALAPLFQEMITIHTRNEADLSAALHRMGEIPDEHGSFMSVVNETIMSVRSFFGGLGESVIPGLVDGERRNVAQYDHALADANVSADARSVLTTNRDRLLAAIEEMRAIKG